MWDRKAITASFQLIEVWNNAILKEQDRASQKSTVF
jgi:hypothetical protein